MHMFKPTQATQKLAERMENETVLSEFGKTEAGSSHISGVKLQVSRFGGLCGFCGISCLGDRVSLAVAVIYRRRRRRRRRR